MSYDDVLQTAMESSSSLKIKNIVRMTGIFLIFVLCEGGIVTSVLYFFMTWLFFLSVGVKADDDTNTQVPEVSVIHDAEKSTVLSKPQAVTVITQKEIAVSGAKTVSQVLATQSNVQLQDLTGDGSEVVVSMRGFGDNAVSNTLILVNGIPQNNPDTAAVNLNQIPVQDIERIVILPGSQSVSYGDQAVAGVIDIITNQSVKPGGAFSASVGSYQHQIYNADFSNHYQNGFNYSINANSDTTDNYRVHNDDNQDNFDGTAGYHYGTGIIGLSEDFYHQNLQFAGALTAAQENQDRQQEQPGTGGNFTDNNQTNTSVSWQQLIGSDWMGTSIFNYRDYGASGILFSPFDQSRQVFYMNPKVVGTLGHSTVALGSDVTQDHYQFNTTDDDEYEHQVTMSAYSTLQQYLTEQWEYDLGARVAYLNNASNDLSGGDGFNSNAFVTNESLLFHLNDDDTFYVRRAGNYRFPKAEEEAELALGATYLKTQTGVDYDIGYKNITDRMSSSIDMYYMSLNNEIVFDPFQSPQDPFGFNENLSPTTREGVDVASTYTVNSHVLVGAQYSYVNAVFSSGPYVGKQIPFVAVNRFDVSTTVTFEPHWSIYTEALMTGKRFSSGDDANVGEGIPAYVIFNTSLSHQIGRLTFSFRVNNIGNVLYNDYATLITEDEVSTEYFYPAPGRNFMFTVSVALW